MASWLDALFGTGGAPVGATYITVSTDATLTNERQLGVGTGITKSDGGAGGTITLALDASGVTAGSYRDAVVTVDTQGRITASTSTANGFEDSTAAAVSIVDGTRTVSVSPTATSYTFWSNGTRFTHTSDSVVIADTEGLHYVYYNGSGVLTDSTTWSDTYITQYAIVACVYWDATNGESILLGSELHGCVMDPATHQYNHETYGARLASGGALTDIVADGDGSSSTHAQAGVAATIIWDEDYEISHALRGSTAIAYLYYRDGSDASNIWRMDDDANYLVVTAGTGRAAYNELSGGTWALTEVTNGDYVLAHVIATNDLTRKYGVIVGQAEYATLAAAQAGALTEVAALLLEGLPSAEFVFLGTVIVQTNTSYSNAVKSRVVSTAEGGDYVDLRNRFVTRSNVAPASAVPAGSDDYQHLEWNSGAWTVVDSITLPAGVLGTTRSISVETGVGTHLLVRAGNSSNNGGDLYLRAGSQGGEGTVGSVIVQTTSGAAIMESTGSTIPSFGAFGATPTAQPSLSRATATWQDVADALADLGWIELTSSWP